MARIRTIKPVFWHDELVGAMPSTARLTFIGLFSLADDEGRMRGSAAYVRSQVFTYDEETSTADVERALLQLHNARRIRIYGDGVQRYVEVVNFLKHQRIDKPQPSQLPSPSRHYPVLRIEGEPEQEILGPFDEVSQSIPVRSGVEGTGLELSELRSSPADALTEKPKRKAAAKAVDDPDVVACFKWYVDLWQKHGQLAIDLNDVRANAIRRALKEHGKEKVAACIRGHHTNQWRHDNGLNANDIHKLLNAKSFDVGVELWAKAKGLAAPSTTGQDDVETMGY
jgi:hypothetical protein